MTFYYFELKNFEVCVLGFFKLYQILQTYNSKDPMIIYNQEEEMKIKNALLVKLKDHI